MKKYGYCPQADRLSGQLDFQMSNYNTLIHIIIEEKTSNTVWRLSIWFSQEMTQANIKNEGFYLKSERKGIKGRKYNKSRDIEVHTYFFNKCLWSYFCIPGVLGTLWETR